MLTDELITYLFDAKPHPLSPHMTEWLSSSRRFAAFVKSVPDKIRKKIRVTQDPETIHDLKLELETAYLLLQERALNLAYEPQLAEKVRSPDFAVTFTTSLTFMLEVTRLRVDFKNMVEATPAVPPTMGERLSDTVCSKLGQLLPQKSNVLLIGVDTLPLPESEIRAVMLRMQQRAERDPAFFQRYRFRDRAAFFSYYQRLSEILVRGTNVENGNSVVTWVNPQARHPLPSRVQTVLHRCLGA